MYKHRNRRNIIFGFDHQYLGILLHNYEQFQVTEEDIAKCMGEVENPLPEVDQDEHPLRILSQENLTIISSFTGNDCSDTDL